MCGAVCEYIGALGWLAFLALVIATWGWLTLTQVREAIAARDLARRRQLQLQTYRRTRFSRKPRFVEIGYLRERVEVLDEPLPPPESVPGRIKHANGENVRVDFQTLERLIEEADAARRGAGRRRLFA